LTGMDLSEWSATVRWHIDRIDDPVWIVAHGFGCLAAVRAAVDCADRVEGAMLVAPFDPDNLRLAWMLPEEPLGFPAAIVASPNDPHMRLTRLRSGRDTGAASSSMPAAPAVSIRR